MIEVLNIIAIIVAGLMVGCELAIAAFVRPTLDKLPDNVHLPAASALARVLGSFMPFWYILVFLLTLASSHFWPLSQGQLSPETGSRGSLRDGVSAHEMDAARGAQGFD